MLKGKGAHLPSGAASAGVGRATGHEPHPRTAPAGRGPQRAQTPEATAARPLLHPPLGRTSLCPSAPGDRGERCLMVEEVSSQRGF